ncbi:MAG: LysR family transcriptional regulator [Eubacterium sp.]|nr:LysR family transcriptional regulator [Eubacterium sp.]
MTSEQIRCFFKIVELGSFAAAADDMYMTRPSLSKKIAALEHELGILLFSRGKSKSTQLTDAGRILYEGFRKMNQEMEGCIEQAKSLGKGMSGSIRLGIYENQIVDEHLRNILDGFSKCYENVELHLTTDSFAGLIEGVKEGKYDCSVTLGFDVINRTGICNKTLYYLDEYLVVPNHYVDAEKQDYKLADFKDVPFLTMREDKNTFHDKMIRAVTHSVQFEPEFVVASDEKNFVMMLEMGKGIAILNAYSKCCNSPHVNCISVPELTPSPFDLVWVEKNVNPAFWSFLDYIDSELDKQQ